MKNNSLSKTRSEGIGQSPNWAGFAHPGRASLYILPLAGYLLLTLLMTWPTALHLTGGIPGDGFDGWQNYWNLWWVKQAHLVEGVNPFFTPYLYPPAGASLLFHTLNIFNGWWTLPIQLNAGLALAYNSVVFFSFVMAGYGAYLLCLYTLNRFFPGERNLRGPAFVGGVVFTMSPFHMAHLLGHMQVFSMLWPPFYVLWLLRTLDPWTDPAGPLPARVRRNATICALFLILATLVDWYHTLYLLLFTGLVLTWMIGRALLARRSLKLAGPEGIQVGETRSRQPSGSQTGRKRGTEGCREERSSGFSGLNASPLLRRLAPVLLIGLIFAVVISPLLLPMIRAASSRADLETGLFQNVTLSADLLAFFLPSELHPWWGEWARGIANNFKSTTSERLIFVGFVPLALGLFITFKRWSRTIIKFWVFLTGAFFALALGPYLHFKGSPVSLGGWELPMPYLLLYHTVPFIGLTRSLSRYSLMVMLGLGVLVTLALADLGRRRRSASKAFPREWSPALLSLLATGLICFEFLVVPYPVSKIDTPQFFYDLATQPEPFTIAELPMDWDRPTPLLHQTTHGKGLLTAYTSRNNPLELAWRVPVFQHWRNLGPDIIDQPLEQIAPTIFYDFNLRYLVLDYWQMPPGPVRDATEHWVQAALPLGLSPVYDNGRLKVYQSPPKGETQPYLSLGQGWGERQVGPDGMVTRAFWMDAPPLPELFIHHPQGQSLVLEITAAISGTENGTLQLFAGEAQAGAFSLGSTPVEQKVSLPASTEEQLKLNFGSASPGGQVLVSRLGLTIPDEVLKE